MKKIDSFFKPVSAMRNRDNLLLDKISLEKETWKGGQGKYGQGCESESQNGWENYRILKEKSRCKGNWCLNTRRLWTAPRWYWCSIQRGNKSLNRWSGAEEIKEDMELKTRYCQWICYLRHSLCGKILQRGVQRADNVGCKATSYYMEERFENSREDSRLSVLRLREQY